NDEKTVQSGFQSAGGVRSDPGGKDTEPLGLAVQGASHPDREGEEIRGGATARAFCGWADSEGCAGRDRQRCALRRDRPTKGRAGLAQKKSWNARLRICGSWWIG